MNTFKIKQLSRVSESIGKAANLSEEKLAQFINKYTEYSNYEVAIKDLVYEVYENFYYSDNAICDYSLDMIKNIGSNFFSSKEEMINYASSRKKDKVR